jgi:hypothetical protein
MSHLDGLAVAECVDIRQTRFDPICVVAGRTRTFKYTTILSPLTLKWRSKNQELASSQVARRDVSSMPPTLLNRFASFSAPST